jgi:erythromycin esterase-like protein
MRDATAAAIRRQAIPLDASRGIGPILDLIGDATVVLIGEASHGTHEFYQMRAHVTQGLIASRGQATTLGLAPPCDREVIAQLLELQRRAAEYMSRDGLVAAAAYFSAEQNARVVSDAESYYRVMFGSGRASWNLRDRHMMATLESVMRHVQTLSGTARAVVWAHNSHLGDARATQMGTMGEINLGQLVRERYGDSAVSIGFTTHTGSVTQSHYFMTSLADQFDIVIHVDETRGVEPLELWWRKDADLPETWPTGV